MIANAKNIANSILEMMLSKVINKDKLILTNVITVE